MWTLLPSGAYLTLCAARTANKDLLANCFSTSAWRVSILTELLQLFGNGLLFLIKENTLTWPLLHNLHKGSVLFIFVYFLRVVVFVFATLLCTMFSFLPVVKSAKRMTTPHFKFTFKLTVIPAGVILDHLPQQTHEQV